MLITDLLCETFPYPPGSEMPATITDYRDPGHAKGKYQTYSGGYRTDQGKRRFWNKTPRTHLVLTRDGGISVYYYGNHNTMPWGDLLSRLQSAIDPLQGDVGDIAVKGPGYLIARSREFAQWSGDRNRYSADIVAIVRALADRGVTTPSMPIWLGNSASNKGEHIGTVKLILADKAMNRQITLYHGTDNFRLEQIMKTGLRPMTFDERVWNNQSREKERPAHREEAIYLTASRPQAEYYAMKAVNVDRKRFSPTKQREAERIRTQAMQTVTQMTAALARFDRMTPEQIEAEDAHTLKYNYRADPIASKRVYYPKAIAQAQAIVDQTEQLGGQRFYGKFEPVILQVTLYKSEFAKLMADDDFLRQNADATPEEWQRSLSQFGQIAFKDTIPPERLKVVASGKDAGRQSN